MSQAAACIPLRARVVTLRTASNDNPRPDPRWSAFIDALSVMGPLIVARTRDLMLAGYGYDDVAGPVFDALVEKFGPLIPPDDGGGMPVPVLEAA